MGGDQDVVDFDTWQQLAGEMTALPLLFNAPLSERHAALLIDDLNLHEKCHILDLGCGWGELLLRALATTPGAIGVGVDHNLTAVSRARVAAAERNLLQRATFVCADLRTYTGPASDVVFAIGIGRTTRSSRHTLVLSDLWIPTCCCRWCGGALLRTAD
jgi:trans-aconitate methyltransferase